MGEYRKGALSAFLAKKKRKRNLEKAPEVALFKKPKPNGWEQQLADLEATESKKKHKKNQRNQEEEVNDGDQEEVPQPTKTRVKKKAILKEELERTIFVGNLPVSVAKKKKRLIRIFSEFGEVEAIRFRSFMQENVKLPRKAAFAKSEFDPSHQQMNAYIKFKSADSAKQALNANGKEVEDRHIRVDLCSKNKSHYDTRKSVFLGNIPFEADEEELRDHFQDCGEVVAVRIVRDRHTMQGKGFGFLQFKDGASVNLALRLDGEKFKRRALRVTKTTETGTSDKQKKGKEVNSEKTPRLAPKKAKKLAKKKKIKKSKSLMH